MKQDECIRTSGASTSDGSPQITLTVSDGLSESTATTGDGTIPGIDLVNVAPFVGALDAEVLAGSTGEIVCRFIDPGPQDAHTGGLSVTDQDDWATDQILRLVVGSFTVGIHIEGDVDLKKSLDRIHKQTQAKQKEASRLQGRLNSKD